MNNLSSPIVQQEISLGDQEASQKRLDVLEKLALLDAPKDRLDSFSDDLIFDKCWRTTFKGTD